MPASITLGRKLDVPPNFKRGSGDPLFARSTTFRVRSLWIHNVAPGPFTVFVPVDQAFEILVKRFGGMEKATEEFNKNPEVLNSVSAIYFVTSAPRNKSRERFIPEWRMRTRPLARQTDGEKTSGPIHRTDRPK